jgi:uncharacterized protein (UPF0548 family)
VELTYAEVGATRDGDLPDGYRRIRARALVGRGPHVFAAAVRGLRSFDMQRGAGLRVRFIRSGAPPSGAEAELSSLRTDAPGVEVAAEVAMGMGVGPLRLWAPCRVVWVIDEPRLYGYGYGTLPGHPESGEEGFLVSLDEQEFVRLEIRAFSRPARWFARWSGPAETLVQDWATDRYRASLVRLATTDALPRRAE